MNQQDKIQFTILEDGTISVTTDQVSGENHVSADQLLAELGQVLGGEVVVKQRSKFDPKLNLAGALHKHASDGHTHTH